MRSVLLIGLGRFGRHLARGLSEQNCQIVAIDTKEDRVKEVMPYLTEAFIGDSTNKSVLEPLGISEFDICFVAIGSDFQGSLETTYLLKELGAKKIIARASKGRQAKFLMNIGADEIIYPEKQIASWASIRYSSDRIFDYIEVKDGFGIYEIQTPIEWVGKTIGEINVRRKYNINIMAIKKDNDEMNMEINITTSFDARDRVLVLGKAKDIKRFMMP